MKWSLRTIATGGVILGGLGSDSALAIRGVVRRDIFSNTIVGRIHRIEFVGEDPWNLVQTREEINWLTDLADR